MKKNEQKTMQVTEQEMVQTEDLERTRERQCFIPKTDIYENEQGIVIVADLPGFNRDSIDITLDKNILTIEAFANSPVYDGLSVTYSEYVPGDFRRQFRLTREINQEKIDAVVADGILKLTLPKAEIAKIKKIPIKTG